MKTAISVVAVVILGASLAFMLVATRSTPASPPLEPTAVVEKKEPVPDTLPPATVDVQVPPQPITRPVVAPPMASNEAPKPTLSPTDPVPFPRDVRAEFTPEGFADVLSRSITDCNLPLSNTRQDCSEYPCIAIGSWDHAIKSTIDLSTCAPWSEAFGDRTMVITRRGADGQPQAVFAAIPGEGPERRAALARVRNRVASMLAPTNTPPSVQ